MNSSRNRFLERLFTFGVWCKGLNGVLELAAGALVLLLKKAVVYRIVRELTQQELLEDPTDWIATHLRQMAANWSGSWRTFSGVYLLVHGTVKVWLVWGGLLRHKLWAFPTALVLLSGMVAYQLYRIATHFSIILTAFTLIDLGVLFLIGREYRVVRLRKGVARHVVEPEPAR